MQSYQREELISLWNDLAEREMERELKNPRKQVHTDLLWREIYRSIGDHPKLTILDAGAGPGRFSIPLAQAGHQVTHLDISDRMLEKASSEGKARGISTIDFVIGSIDDLSRFGDNIFDLVLCLDSPLSFCYDGYDMALNELIRVTHSKIILCVMNRLGQYLRVESTLT